MNQGEMNPCGIISGPCVSIPLFGIIMLVGLTLILLPKSFFTIEGIGYVKHLKIMTMVIGIFFVTASVIPLLRLAHVL